MVDRLRDGDVMSLDDDIMPAAPTTNLQLLTKDGQVFPLPRAAAAGSELLRTMMEGDPDAVEVTLIHIEAKVLKLVCDYLTYHADVPARVIDRPLQSMNLSDLVDAFDTEFIQSISQEMLFKLLLAANYLNVRSLIALCCAKIATMIKDKSPEQVRNTFGIRHDGTAQELQDIQSQFKDLIG